MPIPMSDYPRPKDSTGIGWHLSPSIKNGMGEYSGDWPAWLARLKDTGATWAKVMSGGTSSLDLCKFLLANGIMPIVRLYRGAPNPGSMVADDHNGCAAVGQFVAAGCPWMECNNEPNLFDEWAGDKNTEGVPFTWQNANPNQADLVADSWVKDATFVLDHGGLPGIPAMAPGGHIDDQKMLTRFFDRIIATGNKGIMERGVWLSVHPAGFNHPLDYPLDAVNQTGLQLTREEYDKHQWRGDLAYVNAQRTQGRNAGQTIMDPGASNGWRKWEMVEALFESKFGFKVPVLAAEGGFWKGEGQDPRYHILNEWDVSYLTRTTSEAIMNGQYPDWFFCTGYWLLASKGMGGIMAFEHQAAWSPMAPNGNYWPVVDNLREMAKHPRLPYVGAPVIPPVVPPPYEPIQLTDARLAEVCRGAGFTGDNLMIAVAVVLAESGGRADARGDVDFPTPGEVSLGLFQIHFPTWAFLISQVSAINPVKNAAAAFTIWNDGKTWAPWSTFNNGMYLAFMDRALAVTGTTPVEPDAEDFRGFAYWSCLKVPYNPDAALMKEGRRLGGVPLSPEGQGNIMCGMTVGQVFLGPIDGVMRVYLLWCKLGDWQGVKRFIL